MSINFEIPDRLNSPSDSSVSPPVQTNHQELPFGELRWEDFEKICLRLIHLEADVMYCRQYGEPGEEQGGIDIYAKHKDTEKYSVYQCKRVNNFGPSKIKEAIEKFLEGEWCGKANTFVLCTKESLRPTSRTKEFEKQRENLQKQEILLLAWDSQELNLKLKSHPLLVNDFFSKEWVIAFCGKDEANKIGKKLDTCQVSKLREDYLFFYRDIFNKHDPGLPIAKLGEISSISLEKRYILPNISTRRQSTTSQTSKENASDRREIELQSTHYGTFATPHRTVQSYSHTMTYQQLQGVENWLSLSNRNLVIGKPGSGKSSLLRFLALDLLQKHPSLSLLAQKWQQCLPIWVPFSFWTRMISVQTTEFSLQDVIYHWIRNLNGEKILPLIEHVWEEEKYVLLIDGLDEYINEMAGKIALFQLSIFIKQYKVPIIISSRPDAPSQLGMSMIDWQIGELSDFSTDQQKQLVKIWFSSRIESLNQDVSLEKKELEQKSEIETQNFMAELHRLSDMQELAKIPLLLNLLICQKFANARLPRNRFKAYDAIIEHLISTHPQERKIAALDSGIPSEFTSDEFKKILAYLAYCIQLQGGGGQIEFSNAEINVNSCLKNSELGFGFPVREAQKYTKQLLETCEHTIGILVEKSSSEIGFFHRVFQEYLAAHYLSSTSLEKQISTTIEQCTNSQWREVIVGLLYLIKNPADTKKILESIKKKSKKVTDAEKLTITDLLSEVSFGEFNCSVQLARKLAKDTFALIESDCWMPHRERLLHHVLEGLRSTKVKEQVKIKLRQWFPSRTRWRSSIFEAMANWERSPEIIDCLLKGLHDEELNNQKSAAKALAKIAKADPKIKDSVFKVVTSNVNANTRAAAIEALLYGWPNEHTLFQILDIARNSLSPELRLIAILGKIQLNRQTENDLDEFLKLCLWERIDFYERNRNNVIEKFAQGWPISNKAKETCLGILKKTRVDYSSQDEEMALNILIANYPKDEEIAEYCADRIKHSNHPFATITYEPWQLLQKNFKNHPKIVNAIDEWIINQKVITPYVAWAALVGCTQKVKELLLSSLLNPSSYPHWPVWALLEGWGMQEAVVAEKLKKMALGDADEASRIAYLLPKIIEDKKECRKKLLNLLRSPKCVRPDFVLSGLEDLGNTQGDTEVVNIFFEKVLPRLDKDGYDSSIYPFIVNYSSDKRVKEWAKQEIGKRHCNYPALAQGYPNDKEIQKKIIEIICPLPDILRKTIAKYLEESRVDDAFALSLLSEYDLDNNAEVKTQASISFHKILNNSYSNDITENLSKNFLSYGLDWEGRRQAAFCGLVTLGRLDIFKNIQDIDNNSQSSEFSVFAGIDPNIPLINHILENWDNITSALGTEFITRISGLSSVWNIWDALCIFAEKYPSPCAKILQMIENKEVNSITPNMLYFLARAKPKSKWLLENCLDVIHKENKEKHPGEMAKIAAELLGLHFGGNPDVLKKIISNYTKGEINEKIILALCEGWPDSEELEEMFDIICESRELPITYLVRYQLCCRKSKSETVFKIFKENLANMQLNHLYYLQFITAPLVRRIQNDEKLSKFMMNCLQDKPTPSEKGTIPRLLGAACGLSSELRLWCKKEMTYQTTAIIFPEIGIDLIYGSLRPVSHALFDTLKQSNYL